MNQSRAFFHKCTHYLTSPVCLVHLITAGLFFRLTHYLQNHSFWADEAWVSNVIIKRSFLDMILVRNLDRHDPIGFGLILKSFTIPFGTSEYALRLFPLLCSIGALFLFYNITKDRLEPKTRVSAVALFAFCDRLINYAAEVHPYSSDVLITLVILWLYLNRLSRPEKMKFRDVCTGAAAGGVFVWISYPSIFTLSALGLLLAFNSIARKDLRYFSRVVAVGAVWLASFSIYYLHYILPLNNIAYMKVFAKNLNPFPILSLDWMTVFFKTLLDGFQNPAGHFLSFISLLMFLTGCFALGRRNKCLLAVLLFPVILTISADILRIYPHLSRLVLFLIPFHIILIAEGLNFFLSRNTPGIKAVGRALATVVFAVILTNAVYFMFHYRVTQIRPLVKYLTKHMKKSDALYMNDSAQFAFFYYFKKFDFPHKNLPVGVYSDKVNHKEGKAYLNYIHSYWKLSGETALLVTPYKETNIFLYQDSRGVFKRNSRSWFLLSHIYEGQEAFLVRYLNSIGTKVEEIRDFEAVLYLYDIKAPGPYRWPSIIYPSDPATP